MKIIPQVPLSTILAKFDGESTQEIGPTLKRHHLTRLPPYLILHIKRFTKNNFVEEKNPTIVNYPMAIDLKDCKFGRHQVSCFTDANASRCGPETVIAIADDVQPSRERPARVHYRIHK